MKTYKRGKEKATPINKTSTSYFWRKPVFCLGNLGRLLRRGGMDEVVSWVLKEGEVRWERLIGDSSQHRSQLCQMKEENGREMIMCWAQILLSILPNRFTRQMRKLRCKEVKWMNGLKATQLVIGRFKLRLHNSHSVTMNNCFVSGCYSLNVCVPLKFIFWNLMPNVIVLEGGAFGSWVAFMNMISALLKETSESSLAPSFQHMKAQQENNHLWTKKWAFTRHQIYQRHYLGLPASRFVKKKCLF